MDDFHRDAGNQPPHFFVKKRSFSAHLSTQKISTPDHKIYDLPFLSFPTPRCIRWHDVQPHERALRVAHDAALVDRADRRYTLTMDEVPEGVTLVVDGQIRRPFAEGDAIHVVQSQQSFQLARIPGHSYYSALRNKLGWSGQVRGRGR